MDSGRRPFVSAAYFAPLAKTVVKQVRGWAVWAVERRENLLEDQSVLDRAKEGMATPQEVFDYYLGWLVNPAVTTHFQLIPDAKVSWPRASGSWLRRSRCSISRSRRHR